MPERPIRQLGDPILRAVCAPIERFDDPALPALLADLRDTLDGFRRTHGFGRGIAAPQIGVARRAVFVNLGEPWPLLNPRIVDRSHEVFELWDDCFSFPDLLVRVLRYTWITVRWEDPDGVTHERRLDGSDAELLQHELDHLDGILAVDRAWGPDAICVREEWVRRVGEARRYGPVVTLG